MPPKKKNQANNAFFFFMKDWKAEKESQGQRFKDLKEVSELCAEDWKYLPKHNLEKYKIKELEAKNKRKTDLTTKYNSLGVTFEEIENQKRSEEASVQKMFSDINNILTAISGHRGSLMKHCFYLVHTNIYCYWGPKKVYIPCEVAISKFNLESGVIDTYHVFPSPHTENGDIPLGYKSDVRQNCNTVHEIPEPSEFDQLEYDWSKIRSDVRNFLMSSGEKDMPPVFTIEADDPNTNCYITAVRNFFDSVTGDSADEFRVYSLSLLFFKLYEACQNVAARDFQDHQRAFPVEGVAHQQLLKDIYNFSSGIACKFHENTDHYHNCSLSFVRRWVYLMCEFCCMPLRIELIPGRHCLATAKISKVVFSEPQGALPLQTKLSVPFGRLSESASNRHCTDSDSDDGIRCTVPKVQQYMQSLNLGEEKVNSNDVGAWTTVAKGLHSVKNTKKEDRKGAVDKDEQLFFNAADVRDPQKVRIFRTGQSSNVVSEVMPDSAPASIRLPTTRGRGETMARALGLNQSPGASFSSEDFPAIGDSKPGRLAKPLAAGWGRGFLKQ